MKQAIIAVAVLEMVAGSAWAESPEVNLRIDDRWGETIDILSKKFPCFIRTEKDNEVLFYYPAKIGEPIEENKLMTYLDNTKKECVRKLIYKYPGVFICNENARVGMFGVAASYPHNYKSLFCARS